MAAPYIPITVFQSDGVQEYQQNGQTVDNAPLERDQNPAPDASGKSTYYVRLDYNDQRHLQWRRKLGGMMMTVLTGSDQQEQNYILRDFPGGYVLWIFHKKKKDLPAQDRADTFVYGYPGGRNRRYRSPQEFFPHLLWLATTITQDMTDCSCKFCAPSPRGASGRSDNDDGEDGEDGDDADVTVATPPSKNAKTTQRASGVSQVSKITPTVHRQNSGNAVTRRDTVPGIYSEQQRDLQPRGDFLYRPGEIVWYHKGQAWGLAVVCNRNLNNSKVMYQVQPLCHPLKILDQVSKEQSLLRPWLAWSAPPAFHEQLRHLTYDQVPWNRVLEGKMGPGDAEVDGSILAAKAVDASYTPFAPREQLTGEESDMYYDGLFLGAEKAWVGEPLCLFAKPGNGTVFVVHEIVETRSRSSPLLAMVGDVYEIKTKKVTAASSKGPNLPARMVADLDFRNRIASNLKLDTIFEWRQIEVSTTKTLDQIKGRWYETQLLLPQIRPEEAQKEALSGKTTECSFWMNSRGQNTPMVGERKATRLEALGLSVPRELEIEGFTQDGNCI